MRAAVVSHLGPPDVLEVRSDWPEPDPPGEGQLLIRVEAAGLNPSDVKRRGGLGGGAGVELPYVSGREAAGTVMAVGPGVDDFVPGDPVFSFFASGGLPGGHAEQIVLAASVVAHRPSDVPLIDAAAVPLAGMTAWQALRLLDPEAGAPILITGGAGGVGCFAIQMATARGLEVITTASRSNHEFVLGLGAARVVDYHDPDEVEAVAGTPYLLDLVGPGTITTYQAGLAPGGRIVAVAGLPGGIRPDLHAEAMGARPGTADLAELAGLLESGKLSVTVQEVFPLERVADAHRLLEEGHVRGKLVIDINAGDR